MKTFFASALIVLSLSTASLCSAETPATFRSQVLPRTDALKVDVVVEKPTDARLTVELLDASGQVLAFQTVSKGESAARTRFDLTALPDGRYTVVISDGTHSETKAINLQTPATTRTLASR